MELVLKYYDNQFSTTITRQIQNIISCNITFDINNYGVANISIPLIEGINKFDKIEIYEVQEVDNLVFTGYIWDFEVNINNINLFCRTTKDLMNYKLLLTDKSYTSQTISYIMNDIISGWNTAYSESLTFYSNDTTLITKDFKQGDDFYGILEELSGLIGYVWDVVDNEIRVLELLGEDKTVGIDYIELLYNGKDPYSSNIANPSIKTYSSLKNIIIGSDNTSKIIKTDSTSISENGALAEYKTFREGDLNNSTENYLNSKKVQQKVFTIDILDYNLNINAGDKIKLIIENANSYLNFNGEVIVNKQSIEYTNRTKIQKFDVSDIYVYYDTIQNRIRNIEKNLKLNSL